MPATDVLLAAMTLAQPQLDLLQTLFDQMPAAVAAFDRDMRLLYCNPLWAALLARYSLTAIERIVPGASFFDLAPGNEAGIRPIFERVLAGETVRQDAFKAETDGIVSYWDAIFTPLFLDGAVAGILDVNTDATGRVLSYQGLEQRVQERTHELATLLEVSHNMASTLDLEPLLGSILDQLRAVVPFDGASILSLEDDTLRVVAYRGPITQEQALHISFSLRRPGINQAVIEGRAPVIIADVRGADAEARAFRVSAGAELESTFGYIRSWLGVPLIHKERVIGMLSIDHSQPDYYTLRHGQLALAFAGQVAVALENARLYHGEQERREEAERRRAVAEGLRDILTVLNSNRPLDEILEYIVAQAGRLLGSEAGAVYRLDPATRMLTIQAALGLPAAYVRDMALPLGGGTVGLAVLQRRPVVVRDIASTTPAGMREDPVRREHLAWLLRHFTGATAVPLVVKDELYGGIVLFFPEARDVEAEELELAVSFADQAALAIENARLREQAQQAAVVAERSRLARDLHDAVTQTLFSASLIAEVLPRLWDRNHAEGRRRLEELRQLTRGALAEMRTLLLELRPSALTEASLPDLLRQLSDAISGRARVPVSLAIEDARAGGSPRLAADVQIALYRIAQEALNNVARHSSATEAWVTLGIKGDASVELQVADNGQGFDLKGVPPDHLGLGIMAERAEAIGAQLEVRSQPGEGTQVIVKWEAAGQNRATPSLQGGKNQ